MQHLEKLRFELKKPLLILKAERGILACGYVNVETCNKTDEACAIVTGVNSYEDMYRAQVVAASNEALRLGVALGDSGEAALQKMS